MTERADVVVVGAGVAGLAAGWGLGERALLLERAARPGGLVRSERIGDYWFDHVIHLLHLTDPALERRLRGLIGPALQPCPPRAWVECAAGTTRYPLQNHLWGLDPSAVQRCVDDFVAASESAPGTVGDHEQGLLATFGRGLCELFFFPYQRKMWKRPLASLAPAGFQWNIARPDAETLLRGARAPATDADGPAVYNHNGWYPRPEAGAPVRGMEVLSRALAAKVSDVRLRTEVVSIDPAAGRVHARDPGGPCTFRYEAGCVSTLPLPITVAACAGAPASLKEAVRRLPHNRVRSVMLCIEGPRPIDPGLWRYYADPSIAFSRLIFMTEFDPLSAPDDGWGVLVEITERAEDAPAPEDALVDRVVRDLRRVGRLPDGHRVVASRVLSADPAYVVFTPEAQEIIANATAWLRGAGIEPLGRYGRWEYSSMASAVRDGLACAELFAGSEAASA